MVPYLDSVVSPFRRKTRHDDKRQAARPMVDGDGEYHTSFEQKSKVSNRDVAVLSAHAFRVSIAGDIALQI